MNLLWVYRITGNEGERYAKAHLDALKLTEGERALIGEAFKHLKD